MLLTTFDFFFRGTILLGSIVIIFSNLKKIGYGRRVNEGKKRLNYYHTWLQQAPLYADYITSILIGLSILRVGSFLHFGSSGEITASIFHWTFFTNEQIIENQLIFILLGVVGALSYLIFSFLLGRTYSELGSNFSLFIDIKEGNYLVQDGIYATIRHPMYLSQIILPLAASLTLMSWTVFLWGIVVVLPLYILRAKKEDELLEHFYENDFRTYKRAVGGFFPIFK